MGGGGRSSHSLFLEMEAERDKLPHMLRNDYVPIFVVKLLHERLAVDGGDDQNQSGDFSSRGNFNNSKNAKFLPFAKDSSKWRDDTLLEDNPDFEGMILMTKDELNYAGMVLRFAKDVIECLSLEKKAIGRHFTEEFEYPCLELLYLMDVMYGLLHSSAYIMWIRKPSQIKYFQQQLLAFCFSPESLKFENRERSNKILDHFLECIILTHYCNPGGKKELDNAKTCCRDILKQITLRLISKESYKINPDNHKNVLAVLNDVDIPDSVRQKYYSEHLQIIFQSGKKPHLPGNEILRYQEQFSDPSKMLEYECFGLVVSQMIRAPMSSKDVIRVVSNIISTDDAFSWEMLLYFITVWLEEKQNKATVLLKDIAKSLIREGLMKKESVDVTAGFIIARHCCLVASSVFSRYEKWFTNMFDSGVFSPAKEPETFKFLTSTLTNWIPYEPSCFLHVHVTFRPFIPGGCREVWNDYLTIAKVRISEYKEVEEAMEYEPNSNDPHQYEVEMAIKNFEATGKIPQNILKMWIFSKQHYLNEFLPLLLRKPTGVPLTDARLRLIELLKQSGKVPAEMYNKYRSSNR